MKLTVARGELVDALSVVSRGLSSRSTLPILSGILVSASSDGAVSLQATDLEVSVRKSLPLVSVEREGVTVVPGRLFSDIVRSLPEAAVTLSLEGDTLAISCMQSSFTVRTLGADDFPRFPEITPATSISLPSESVSEIVHHVSRAVSRDETRPVLTGILLTVERQNVRMVATDSYRLAVKEDLVEGANLDDLQVVVPGKVMEEVSRIAPEGESITIGVSENQAVFMFGTTEFVARRIEGTFPNYRQLIPKESETKVSVSREETIAAVKRVSLLAQHNTPLRMTVNAEDQTLGLSAQTADIGDASEDLMATVEGPDVEIAFNHSFLLDGLMATGGESVRIDIVSPLKPGVVTSPDDEGFLYLLMPVRLG
ncbi:MAG: DNA polymerase III subunit beta [Coriobacteriia bacterium]|jgi:DNA polymerase-3 subunit beta|nr:DNA polymerase III subunit beta [Coriobacteriia bacterium]